MHCCSSVSALPCQKQAHVGICCITGGPCVLFCQCFVNSPHPNPHRRSLSASRIDTQALAVTLVNPLRNTCQGLAVMEISSVPRRPSCFVYSYCNRDTLCYCTYLSFAARECGCMWPITVRPTVSCPRLALDKQAESRKRACSVPVVHWEVLSGPSFAKAQSDPH